MNWARGFLRAWLVVATLWVGYFGWNAFANNTWSGWRSYPIADDSWAKVTACSATEEDAKPILQHVSYLISSDWDVLKSSISIVLLPPLALLIAGCVFNWIIKGFRSHA
jgi:hypothetical protein